MTLKLCIGVETPELADQIIAILPDARMGEVYFSEQELVSRLEQGTVEFTHVFVQESLFTQGYPWQWMERLRSLAKEANVIIGVSSRGDSVYREIIERLALDFHISLIAPYRTLGELVKEVEDRVVGRKPPEPSSGSTDPSLGKLLVIMSAAPKDGATTVALSSAISLAKATSKPIALLDLNLKSPELQDYLRIKATRGLPVIQADCDSQTLDPEVLRKACVTLPGLPNLFILTGLKRREWAERLTQTEIEHLIAVARQTFELVIADVHTFPDQAATIQCIKEADVRYIVTQPIVSSYQSSWLDWFRSVWRQLGLTEQDFLMVVNRTSAQRHTGPDIRRNTGSEVIAVLPDAGIAAGSKSVNDGEPLYLAQTQETENFRHAINKLCEGLAQTLGWTYTTPEQIPFSKKKNQAAMLIPFIKNLR